MCCTQQGSFVVHWYLFGLLLLLLLLLLFSFNYTFYILDTAYLSIYCRERQWVGFIDAWSQHYMEAYISYQNYQFYWVISVSHTCPYLRRLIVLSTPPPPPPPWDPSRNKLRARIIFYVNNVYQQWFILKRFRKLNFKVFTVLWTHWKTLCEKKNSKQSLSLNLQNMLVRFGNGTGLSRYGLGFYFLISRPPIETFRRQLARQKCLSKN